MTRLARMLLYAGIAVVVLGLSRLHAAANGYDLTGSSRFGWALLLAGLLGISAYALGFPEVRPTRREAWLGSVGLVSFSVLALSLIQLLAGSPLLPRFVTLGSAGVLVPWCVLSARLGADRARGTASRTRVAVVARSGDLAGLADEVAAARLDVDVVVKLTPQEATTTAGGAPLLDAVGDASVEVLVLCRDAQADESIVAQAALLHETGVRIRTLALFYEQWLGKVPVSELERMSLLFDIGEVHRVRYGRAKRVVDVLVAVPGLVALGLVVPLVWLANRLTGDRGPLLFRQERVGRSGAVFTILKLRTMRAEEGTDGPSGRWTAEHDPRVTTVGRFLRRTHLDELPQLINVLRADLSIVGPRPEQPRYVDELRTKLPFYDLRHIVRPGLTGWAQVCYGYAGDERGSLEKLQFEFHYLRHQSTAFDLKIMGRTLRSVFGGFGAGR